MIALKAITNGLVVAIYSNGTVQVVRAIDARIIVDTSLSKYESLKVTQAEIASYSALPEPDGETSPSKTI